MFRTPYSSLPSCVHSSSKVRSTSRLFSSSAIRSKQRLVILGSGWGGYEVLRGVDKKRWNVTMLSPTNAFNFTPLLASCAVGTLEFRCAIEPVRKFSPQVAAYQAWCDAIDFEQKTLKCMPATPPLSFEKSSAPMVGNTTTETQFPGTGTPFTLRYDKLVISVGAYSQTFNVPGVKEYAHFLKDVRDARSIRTRIIECFEQANQPIISDVERRRLLNFCIVGGGPTGVEFAAELHDLLHAEIEKHYPSLARMAKITLYDVAPNILGNFDKSLGVYAVDKFQRDGISIKTRHHVERVEKDKMFVKEQGEVPFGLLVWSTGLAPNPLIQSIKEVSKDEKTQSLLTDEQLNVIKQDGTPDPNVWAIGDASVIPNARLPATAQVANQKAKYLVKKLNKIVKDQEHTKPFEFLDLGSMAYLGDWKAIYDRSGADTGIKTKESGRLAWLLWRSAYFTMTLSLRNKILVPMYWFMNWIFGRDLTRF
ncbi:NDE1, mitochondrial external NADH dehydrogenase [Serpula lacrymans var. lacrymans S7.3]|uniref:NDE1, mitochondrial external NADH dehydrogenase n=1 Tax=Serpula lacrymans var. lacrymans (strain S7.3) TaxID=936435 RepID=F8PS62_SERL3|nr:NDE1, mitochondrial external NADH dehydrogenase [Serpula lacrymans var. lacrymans S7.3]